MKRFDELDSLRGIAAIFVLISHLLFIYPSIEKDTFHTEGDTFVNVLKYTPIHILWGGHESVVFFFVLSGFVLSLQWINGRDVSYVNYIVKRVCRIYIPYVAAIIIALILRDLFVEGKIQNLSNWFNSIWTEPITSKTLINHLLLVTKSQINSLDPPIWSLAEEMRISIIFPILMILVMRYGWKTNLLIGFLISCISFAKGFNTPSGTMNYIIMFMAGALLAKNKDKLILWAHKFSRIQKSIFVLLGIICYGYAWFPMYGVKQIHTPIIDEWFITVGVSIFIICSLSMNIFNKFLLLKPVHFLGKISYSIYLYHILILFSLIHLLYGKLNMGLIWLLTLIISLLVSTLSYYLIEIPAIKFGKYLTAKRTVRVSEISQ